MVASQGEASVTLIQQKFVCGNRGKLVSGQNDRHVPESPTHSLLINHKADVNEVFVLHSTPTEKRTHDVVRK